MNKKEIICGCIEAKKDIFIDVSNRIWECAELGFLEFKSSEILCSALEKEGFAVEKGLAGIETAFMGSYGSGHPVIAILGEFDALSGLSQEKASEVKKEYSKGGNGHGCGHNILGAGSLAAAIAVKEYIKETGIKGTVRYYGCPGEENGAGKTYMAREGCFRDVDAALTWHPQDTTSIWGVSSLANLSVFFRFTGKAAHAANAPHLGRSALDAVELMDVGVNYLREHIIPEARIHYAITNAGGTSPNVVQQQAEVYYFIRSPKVYQAQEIYDRVCDVARGAALMTGTKCEILFNQGVSDYIPNKVVGEVLYKNLIEIGAPNFDESDNELAKKFRETLDPDGINSILGQIQMFSGAAAAKEMESKVLCDTIAPFLHLDRVTIPGSTDVGDVSYVVPTAQFIMTCSTLGTLSHSWQNTAQMNSSIAYKGMLTAGKALGMAAVDILLDPETADKAKAELNEKTHGEYKCPIPSNVKPAISRE
jgi:aminobenzoyl-glutamate utilization protein B